MKLLYERLTECHSFGSFNCGNSDINKYFFEFAYADQCRGLSSTTVVKSETNQLIVGLYSMRCKEIEIRDLEKLENDIYYQKYWPAIEVTYLAVDKNSQGEGIGKEIIQHISLEATYVTKWLGAKYLFLWSVPNSVEFYSKMGFEKTQILEESDKIPMRFILPEYGELFEE